MSCDRPPATLVRASRAAARWLAQDDCAERLARRGLADSEPEELAAVYGEFLARAHPATDPARSMAEALRRLRRAFMLSLMQGDLGGQLLLDDVFRRVTGFAEFALRTALQAHWRVLCELHGAPNEAPEPDLMVVGMGKLGGGELNVGSDIDLVFVYPRPGQTAGPRALSHHEFYTRLGQRIIDSLSRVTEHGFVFRTDMRLRPFGASGPLVVSLDSLADYCVAHGRPWERYAWAKARALTGQPEDIVQLRSVIAPFVYRRYADHGLSEALADLSRRIRADHGAAERDVKLGAGGIRECEFVLQARQLIHGGRNPALQTPSTRELAERLVRAGLLPEGAAAELMAAYRFLRALEHRIQYLDDQQTQTLPEDADALARLAEAMRLDAAVMQAHLARHRLAVAQHFQGLLANATDQEEGALARLLQTGPEPAPASELASTLCALAGAEHAAAEPFAQLLARWISSSRWATLTARTQGRVARILARMSLEALSMRLPAATIERALALLESVLRREPYITLLAENTTLPERLTHLFAQSAWIARTVTRFPILLDELAQVRKGAVLADWHAERMRLEAHLAHLADDEERALNALREARLAHHLRLAVALIDDQLEVTALADELSALADMLLALALRWVAARHDPEAGAALGVIAYGKAGGKELGFASDLDLVFLYDAAHGVPAERVARLAQRLTTALTVTTTAGILYAVDSRLRPDGASGLLVSSVDAFRDYQINRAWLWEHQALTRARFVAGCASVSEAFEPIRREVLALPRDAADVRREVRQMRDRMRSEQRGETFERGLKHMAQGMIDVEFAVQALVLANAHRHAELVDNVGNRALLARAARLGLLPFAITDAAAAAYLTYRVAQQRAALDEAEALRSKEHPFTDERAAVQALWQAVLGTECR
jgi:glutamate-ammonia-ligase adenylyltransferase